jgi:hypothetical protein
MGGGQCCGHLIDLKNTANDMEWKLFDFKLSSEEVIEKQ